MFDTVLVANRGEIAVRVLRTLRALGIRSVAVYSDADAEARHVGEADLAVRLGPAPAAESYLAIERVIDAARGVGAQAIHPGYGFLAENPAFAQACADAAITFIGPPPAAIDAMGDKITAKRLVEKAGVPVVPGHHDRGLDSDALVAAAEAIGYPVLIKPAAGGGGKGMRLVAVPEQLREELDGARREAFGAFGDDRLLLERFVERPRHIEIQIAADAYGSIVHLGERECSLQRRHQKIVEEAPSPVLTEEMRAAMGVAAVDAARACGYVNLGTVEFIVAATRPDEFFFIEMNTRLQVEHPVTELVCGLDLVELQVRIAAGEPLPFTKDDIRFAGHAIEARIYAEDPARGFLPTGGRVLLLREPDGPQIRVDSGLAERAVVGSAYDPMLAKVVAWGPDRSTALQRLDHALGSTTILGVRTNVAFLRALVAHPEVAAGRLDTHLVERHLDEIVATYADLPHDVVAAAALESLLRAEPQGAIIDPWAVPGGWRLGDPAWVPWRGEVMGRGPVELRSRGRAHNALVAVDDGDAEPVRARASHNGLDELVVTYGSRTRRYLWARDGRTLWLGAEGQAWAVAAQEPLEAAQHADQTLGEGPVRSPMPGTVVAVKVAEGDAVTAGQVLVIVEAMKMEHSVMAPIDGSVAEIYVEASAQVAMDAPLALVVAGKEAP